MTMDVIAFAMYKTTARAETLMRAAIDSPDFSEGITPGQDGSNPGSTTQDYVPEIFYVTTVDEAKEKKIPLNGLSPEGNSALFLEMESFMFGEHRYLKVLTLNPECRIEILDSSCGACGAKLSERWW